MPRPTDYIVWGVPLLLGLTLVCSPAPLAASDATFGLSATVANRCRVAVESDVRVSCPRRVATPQPLVQYVVSVDGDMGDNSPATGRHAVLTIHF